MAGILTPIRSAFALATSAPAQAAARQAASPWRADDILSQITLAELFGTANMPIGRTEALSTSPVVRARNLICQQVARFPLRVTRDGLPVAGATWADQIEASRARTTTMTWIMDALFFHGRAYLEVTYRRADEYPSRFAWVPEWQARTDGGGMLLAVGDRKVGPNDWVRIDGPHEGILNLATADIRDAIALKRATSRAYKNPVPSVVLQQTGGQPLTDTEIDKIIARWVAARASENGGVGFANNSIAVTPLSQAPEQLMITARTQSALDISRHSNLPAWAIDVSVEGSGMNYTNVPARSRELLDYTLQPYIDAFTGRMSLDDVLPHGQQLTCVTSAFLAGDFQARMTGYQTAIAAGIYTADECRMIEAGQPVPLRTAPADTAPTQGDTTNVA